MALLSNLDIVNIVDAFPYLEADTKPVGEFSTLYTLLSADSLGTFTQGYIHAPVLEALLRVPVMIRGEITVDEIHRTVLAFTDSTEADRTARIRQTFDHIIGEKEFQGLKKFKGEPSPVFARDNVSIHYSVDRSVTEFLGVMRWGVHMTAYVLDESAPYGMKIWIPRRAATKSYPNMLDNAVAGGIVTGEDPLDGIIREAVEEASLPESLARERIRYAGIVTYIHVGDVLEGCTAGMVHPECHRIFDIELPSDFTPIPREGEVADYQLYTVPEVQAQLASGRFKPNCGLIMLEFFIRHGIVTPENEPNFEEIRRRLHRDLPFPGPHRSVMNE
ncbi:hypothetical protein BGZ63DRAFT_517946 [Mariannaea sp. PMI_226]|nr:hypothetical protein BGZ63DRAFT_517946 [Mariannaea sp. PMI_226]